PLTMHPPEPLNPDAVAATGILYVVGTPIGNLEDMTFRAVRILSNVDAIAAEDTRHTGKLLQHFEITTPQISCHQHNIVSRIPALLERLQAGQTIALVSDAGMPGISDPGYELIQACITAGIAVVPIPGPTAAITALSASGLPTDRFCFEGFLPAKGSDRQHRLSALAQETRTMIFYEAPHRLRHTLEDLSTTLGTERNIAVTRELTKRYETFWRGTLAAAIAHFTETEPRGEFTLVVAGYIPEEVIFSETDVRDALVALLAQGMPRSQASRQVAQALNLPRREVYQLALTLLVESD
ncbi:MAG TPA: 16S rRNA (cytidine(1402)-2'-O)-methyltransferase, partial [Stenomitos sp.]